MEAAASPLAASVALSWAGGYLFVALCLVAPPPGIQAMGLTVQAVFYNALGSPQRNCLGYHLKRTILTIVCHGILAGGFGALLLYMSWLVPGGVAWPSGWEFLHVTVPVVGTVLVLGGFGTYLYMAWLWRHPSQHWIVKSLRAHSPTHPEAVVEAINSEVQATVDTFQPVGNQQLIVTQSWLLMITVYNVHIAHQRDVDLSAPTNQNSIQSSYDVRGVDLGNGAVAGDTVQVLVIQVTSVRLADAFTIRLFASDYRQLQARLERDVRNAQAIMVRQTLDEQFLQLLRAQVRDNTERAGRTVPPETEQHEDEDHCMGCMQVKANIRLLRQCTATGPQEGLPRCEGTACFCRPMWCIDCFGRWFLSQQDTRRPDTWMAGSSHCPTCRSRFCLRDIIAVASTAYAV